MMLCILLVIVPAAARLLELAEGEICMDGGICQRVENCYPRLNLKKMRPPVCSYDGNRPIVCCPPEPLSLKKCREFNELCYSSSSQSLLNDNFSKAMEAARRALGLRTLIVGGKKAKPKEYPFMALVGYGDVTSITWACGASIISERFVLTAAHCVNNEFQGPPKLVRVGELNLSTDEDDANPLDCNIERSYVHPQHKDTYGYFDIALLRLERDIYFTEWARPICLHTNKLFESTATAAGWGRIGSVQPTSDSLMKVDLTIYEGSECKQRFGYTGMLKSKGFDTDTMICAGDRKGEKDTCTGDSGGPVLVKSEYGNISQQIGIVSFGRLCGLPNSPAVYTRVAYFVPWIESIVWPQNDAQND